ncbi:hypothetical protein ACFX11_009099 [Malus domestica]
MLFGLKNARATYQRLVNSMFAEQIGKSMEIYVDDMLVKSKHADQHITNLSETFTILKGYQIRLNSNKCAFGICSSKFLGFMISQRGIKANPEKIQTIIDIKEPVTSKDIQAHLRNVAYKQRISNYYDSKVKPRSFKVRDWVLKKKLLYDRVPNEGTLSPNWDGPFEVVGISRPGSYKLRSSNGKTLSHLWNAVHLKYYYK